MTSGGDNGFDKPRFGVGFRAWEECGSSGVRTGTIDQQEDVMPILRQVTTVHVPAAARFVADDVFKSYKEKAPAYARARIAFYLTRQFEDDTKSNFEEHFGGTVEENVPEALLTVWDLEASVAPRCIGASLPKEEPRTARTGLPAPPPWREIRINSDHGFQISDRRFWIREHGFRGRDRRLQIRVADCGFQSVDSKFVGVGPLTPNP